MFRISKLTLFKIIPRRLEANVQNYSAFFWGLKNYDQFFHPKLCKRLFTDLMGSLETNFIVYS